MKAHSLTVPVPTQDNYYWYDDLQQVSRHDRGDLTPSGDPPPPYTGIDPATRQQQENFDFDQTGNWKDYVSQSPSLDQDRAYNIANQITGITNRTSVVQPDYDAAGNMRVMPDPRDWTEQFDCTWDAWNRLVKIERDAAVLESYQYDALTRRTRKTAGSATRDFYYDRQWRSIKEHDESAVMEQQTWSPLDRWTLIRRKRSVSGELDETLYCLRDYLDPVAVVDSGGKVVERYGYDAFGPVRYMDADFDTITTSTVDWNFLFHGEFIDDGTGLYNYGYRYYHPQLGMWPSRDPIGENGGINLYGFVGNNGINWADYLGLKIKRKCDFTIALGHGAEPPDDDGPANNYVDSVLRGAKCGDRVGAVSCYNGHINDAIPEERRLPNIPERRKGVGDPHDGSFRFSELIEAGIKAVQAAENQATEDCKDPETCCSNIKIDVNCLPGGRDDVNRWLTGEHGKFGDERVKRGKALCNYSNTYNCKSGKWSGKLIGEQLDEK